MLANISACQSQMQRLGLRRVWILSGQREWCCAQAAVIRVGLPGDWLWLGSVAPAGFQGVQPAAVRRLLGREFAHGVFDATDGLDVEALAILAGTLSAGSWLLLLAPPWADWPQQVDQDSLRWCDGSASISTPHFIAHLQRAIQADGDLILWRQGQPLSLTPLAERPAWQPSEGQPTREQQQILAQLLQAQSGIWVLTAGRGRGKSALAGMLAQRWRGDGLCWLTAPRQLATATLQHYAAGKVQFWSPDALLAYCQQHPVLKVDWLLIDEAAAIPLPILSSLLTFFPRILLTTTVQGYEGTGRGFLMKFCAALPNWTALSLLAPVRWAEHDPLERWVDRVLLFQQPLEPLQATGPWQMIHCCQSALMDCPRWLRQCYQLLTSAHYRTRPLDLRRMMDAPGMAYGLALDPGQRVIGAIWRVAEGGLEERISREIWAGRRRPRGNLVAQSLAAHSGQWWAPMLQSSRISRIAVALGCRRQGIATALLTAEIQAATEQGDDYLSVSFGFTPALWAFWLAGGFQLVRVSRQKEASSGCYTAMAIYPLSEAGAKLCQAAHRQLCRDSHGLPAELIAALPGSPAPPDLTLNEDDWRELAGFAFAHRPFEASRAALYRLLVQSDQPVPALRCHLQDGRSVEETVQYCGIRGKKVLLSRWREETADALQQLNRQRCAQWQRWICPDAEENER